MELSPIQYSISSMCLPFGLCHNHLHTEQLHKPLPSPLCPFMLQGVFLPPTDIQFLMLSLLHYSGKHTNHIIRAAIPVSCRQNWNPGSNSLCSPHIQNDSTVLCKPHDGLYNQLPVYLFSLICCHDQQVLSNEYMPGDSQVVQWERISLPMQETQDTWVRSLGREDALE